jgi:hypothetical protein
MVSRWFPPHCDYLPSPYPSGSKSSLDACPPILHQGRENKEILRQAQNEWGNGIRMSGTKKITAMLNDYEDYLYHLKIQPKTS